MAKFKVGDRVRLTDTSGLSDAHKGEVGTVAKISSDNAAVFVAWNDVDDPSYYFDHRFTLADPAPTGPRYVVKSRAEMAPGEPYAGTSSDDRAIAEERAARWSDESPRGTERGAGSCRMMSVTARWVVIDTDDDWHRATPTPSHTAPPPPAHAEPPRPSDAEVCAAWADVMYWWETNDPKSPTSVLCPRGYEFDGPGNPTAVYVGGALAKTGVYVDGVRSTLADYQAARSNELRRLAAASAEAERMRVVVQCQDGGTDDV